MASTSETIRAHSDGTAPTADEPQRRLPRSHETLRREHRDGPLNAALKNLIKTGSLLVLHGSALGISDPWLDEQAAWRNRSTQILRENFEQEAAAEFLYATRATLLAGTTRPTDISQIRAIRNGTELLAALRSTLSGQGSER